MTVAADAPLPVPTIAAAEAAPAAALPAQAAQAPVMPAGATRELSTTKPVPQPATAQPTKAQPQSSAPGETLGQDASLAPAKSAVLPAQTIAHDEAWAHPDNTAGPQSGGGRSPLAAFAEASAD